MFILCVSIYTYTYMYKTNICIKQKLSKGLHIFSYLHIQKRYLSVLFSMTHFVYVYRLLKRLYILLADIESFVIEISKIFNK